MDAVFRLGVNETFRFLRIAGNLRRNRADLVYDLFGEKHLWSERTRYINLGYWRNAAGIDEASTHLVHLVGDTAALTSEDRVLDAGFGFGDQAIYWTRTFRPRHIDGVNVSARQVKRGRELVEEAGLSDKITFWLADAAQAPFPDGSFDKIIALESAFHFRTREKFFAAAHRLLRPGGTLVLADFILDSRRTANLRTFLGVQFGSLAWQIPMCNLQSIDTYLAQLRANGFQDVVASNVTADVIPPFERYIDSRLQERHLGNAYHPLFRWSAKLQLKLGFLECLHYYIVSAHKPASSSANHN
jgi:erythromycin 3''-O-methyltransferase